VLAVLKEYLSIFNEIIFDSVMTVIFPCHPANPLPMR